MINRHNHDRRNHKGQGLVEFALIIPIFLLLVYGIFEVARAIFMYSAVLNASRDAARYAAVADAVQVQDVGQLVSYRDCDGIEARAESVSAFVVLSAVAINYDNGPNIDLISQTCETLPASTILKLGDRVSVTVTATFNPVVPILNFTDITLSSTTTRTLVTGVNIWEP